MDEQLKEYINEWRKQRAKEEEELKRLKEKQVSTTGREERGRQVKRGRGEQGGSERVKRRSRRKGERGGGREGGRKREGKEKTK